MLQYARNVWDGTMRVTVLRHFAREMLMKKRTWRNRSLIAGVLSLATVPAFIAGCTSGGGLTSQASTFFGSSVPVGNGAARTFVALDAAGKPSSGGIRFNEA